MTARSVLAEAASRGVRVTLNGDRLKLNAKTKPSSDLLENLRRNKVEIMKLLRTDERSCPEHHDFTASQIAMCDGFLRHEAPHASPGGLVRPEDVELVRSYREALIEGRPWKWGHYDA